jgi:hypothetical protein
MWSEKPSWFGSRLFCSSLTEEAFNAQTIRIVPETETDEGQTISFVLAIGLARQACRLQTTFQTQNQGFSISTSAGMRSSVSPATSWR